MMGKRPIHSTMEPQIFLRYRMERTGLKAITEVQVCKTGGRKHKMAWNYTHPTNDNFLVLILRQSYIGCNRGGNWAKDTYPGPLYTIFAAFYESAII